MTYCILKILKCFRILSEKNLENNLQFLRQKRFEIKKKLIFEIINLNFCTKNKEIVNNLKNYYIIYYIN